MNGPAIVEVTRGNIVESTHAVDVAIVDADGTLMRAWGEPEKRIFPRSAIKGLQALPLVESGAADHFGFEDRHLALACASHNGETMHTEGATEMLGAIGLIETCLECGAQLPKWPEEQAELVKQGSEATAIHNNCSGKHSGFLAFASYSGIKTENYIKIDHPVQKEIAATLEAETGEAHTVENHGIDGCSIPTYHIPLHSLAVAFARFGVGRTSSNNRSKAMTRLRDACMAHPEMVAGRDRVCTQLMQALQGRVFAKVGAEGVYIASLPEKGIGIAMKARDGNFRAVEVAVSTLTAELLELSDAERQAMLKLTNPVLKNWNGMEVGAMSFTS